MAIREFMNKNPMVTTGIAAVIVLIGIVMIVIQMVPKSTQAPVSKGAYFTDDDGKTFFIADPANIPPWDHDGKEADGAVVAKPVEGGDMFVLYMTRNAPKLKAKLESLMNQGGDDAVAQFYDAGGAPGLEVKKPGDAKWVYDGSKASFDVRKPPLGPDGKPQSIITVTP